MTNLKLRLARPTRAVMALALMLAFTFSMTTATNFATAACSSDQVSSAAN